MHKVESGKLKIWLGGPFFSKGKGGDQVVLVDGISSSHKPDVIVVGEGVNKPPTDADPRAQLISHQWIIDSLKQKPFKILPRDDKYAWKSPQSEADPAGCGAPGGDSGSAGSAVAPSQPPPPAVPGDGRVKQIVFIRHGESSAQIAGRNKQDRSWPQFHDARLSPSGKRQAQGLKLPRPVGVGGGGVHVGGRGVGGGGRPRWELFVASPLTRAFHTALLAYEDGGFYGEQDVPLIINPLAMELGGGMESRPRPWDEIRADGSLRHLKAMTSGRGT